MMLRLFVHSLYVLLALLPFARSIPKAIDVIQSAGHLEEHQPNFCNRTDLATENGLQKTALGQFLGYPCSADFFHCRWQSDGFRTYKKSCRVGLVFDTAGTQNCNYDYNVKGCAITSNPEKCANATDFSCPLSEHCVSLGQRCDGVYDCVLEEDEQNCPMCKANEFPCVKSEQCIPMSGRCNGVQECKDGTDEQDCDLCGADNFFCRKSGKCIPTAQRCDGKAQCPQGEDELLCKRESNQMYVCENRQATIPRELVCDGRPNCPDGSDEKYCGLGGGRIVPGTPEKSIEENTISENPEAISTAVVGQPPVDPTAAAAAGVAGGGVQMPSNAPVGTGKLVASFPRIKFNGHSEEEAGGFGTNGGARSGDPAANSEEANGPAGGTTPDTSAPADPALAPAAVDVADGNAAPSTPEAHSGHIGGGEAAEPTTGEPLDLAAEATLKTAPPHAQLMHMKKYRPPAEKLVNPAAVQPDAESPEMIDHSQLLRTVPCVPTAHIQQQPLIECVQPVYQPCIQLPAELPSFVGQEGRKTFAPPTTVNLYRTEATAPPPTAPMPADPLQELSEKYGTNRDELLKKIEQILRNESAASLPPNQQQPKSAEYVPTGSGSVFPPPSFQTTARATTVEPPFHRLPKTIHVTGRPRAHKWHPSLSTNQHLAVTTPSATYRRRLTATNGRKVDRNTARTLHSSPAL